MRARRNTVIQDVGCGGIIAGIFYVKSIAVYLYSRYLHNDAVHAIIDGRYQTRHFWRYSKRIAETAVICKY